MKQEMLKAQAELITYKNENQTKECPEPKQFSDTFDAGTGY